MRSRSPQARPCASLQGVAVGSRGRDNDDYEEEEEEEDRACRIGGADEMDPCNEQSEGSATCVCCMYSTPLAREETTLCRDRIKPYSPLCGCETGLRSGVLSYTCLPFRIPHLPPRPVLVRCSCTSHPGRRHDNDVPSHAFREYFRP